MYADTANEDENDVLTSEVNILDRHKTFMDYQGHFIQFRLLEM